MDHSVKTGDQKTSTTSPTIAHKDNDVLGMLASAYGDSSDSEEEDQKGLVTPSSKGETKTYDQEGSDGHEEARDGRTSDFNCQRLTSEQNGLSKGGKSSLLEIALPFIPRSDDDSCRLHVFCLEHAAEVEQQLRPFGGINLMLLCHPGNIKTTRFILLVFLYQLCNSLVFFIILTHNICRVPQDRG